jgi:hypothetical protein
MKFTILSLDNSTDSATVQNWLNLHSNARLLAFCVVGLYMYLFYEE